MAGTDISDKADGLVAHDHTYFGNGCPGDDSQPESYESCSSKTEPTFDGETQNIGSYYNFQAATASSGVALSEANTIAPDTFCPLGWQMPYSGTGGDYYDKSRSWKVLTEEYEYGDTSSGAAGLKSYPIDYVYSGNYFWNRGRLYALNNNGYYWSSTIWNDSSAANLSTWADKVSIAASNHKALGVNIRCIFIFSVLSSTARWKELMYRLEILMKM